MISVLIQPGDYMDSSDRFKNVNIIALLLILITIPLSGIAGIRDDRSPQIQLMATTFGTGASMGLNLSDHFYLGAEYYAIALTAKGANEEDINGDFATGQLLLRVHPFESSGFYLQAGLVQRNWKFELTHRDTIGSSTETADFKLTMEWPVSATNYAIGFNWVSDFGLSGGLSLGAITGEKPELSGKIENITGPITQEEIDEEVDELYRSEKIDERFSTVLVIGLYLGYNF